MSHSAADLQSAEQKWAAAHVKSGLDSPLSPTAVRMLEDVLGPEGMKRAIENDKMLSSLHFQRHYAANTLLILYGRGHLWLDRDTVDFLRAHTMCETGVDVIEADRALRESRALQGKSLKRNRSTANLDADSDEHHRERQEKRRKTRCCPGKTQSFAEFRSFP
ncbi:hypothetical protein C8Q79DRAFT_1011886 [Trametes meyenii]|nr:hypothetical protein C8Q79DRAFT_1011886 [Trametes meyenii]